MHYLYILGNLFKIFLIHTSESLLHIVLTFNWTLDYSLSLFISKSCTRFDYWPSNTWWSQHFSDFVYLYPQTKGQSLAARIEGAKVLAKQSWKHWNYSMNQINRCCSFSGLAVDKGSFLTEKACVSDVHSQFKIFSWLFNREGIIKVSSIERINSEYSLFS